MKADIEWDMSFDVHDLTVVELEHIMDSLSRINDNSYTVGLNPKKDNVFLEYDNGTLVLYVTVIDDGDMQRLFEIIQNISVRARLAEIKHQAYKRTFSRYYSVFGQQFFDRYEGWEEWKARSGFDEWAQEVYGDAE